MQILVSSCLLGELVRYDGRPLGYTSAILDRWVQENRIISFCPEVAAGLPTPRKACEIIGAGGVAVCDGTAKVATKDGQDLTAAFVLGAEKALITARKNHVRMALLKDGSPSFGSTRIHDGTFGKVNISGCGVTTACLQRGGISVFSDTRILSADAFIRCDEGNTHHSIQYPAGKP